MGETRFDAVTRSLGHGATRRGVLGALAGVAALRLGDALAKGRHRGGKSRGKLSGRASAAAQGPGQGRYQTLAAKWWAWTIGLDNAPINDETGAFDCATGQQGNTWYLAGSDFAVGPIARTCTVPKRTKLFFPVLNGTAFAPPAQTACTPLPEPTTQQLAERRQCLAEFFDTVNPDELTATVDGAKAQIVRAQSALFPLHLDDDNPYNEPPGTVPAGHYLESADGFWVLLDPLSPGDHDIHFTASISGIPLIDVTYELTVA